MQRNLVWVAVTLGSIWAAVLIISLAAPDLVYGEDRTTFPLIPAVTWIWGAAATSFALRALVERHSSPEDQRHAWIGIAAAVFLIWLTVAAVCLLLPTFDLAWGEQTIVLPLGQLLTPAAGAVITGIAGLYVPLLTDVAAAAGRRAE